ncbi:MAG: hemolysin family protein [Candidatus Omnitrophota bacterium]|nr:HlyC/CorC family transporter [Candidatus Omnitrophota bacterium]MBU3929350.1 hemolysin family protein [bacterium]MBU4122465.1 hemolysin family protein [bacterium]
MIFLLIISFLCMFYFAGTETAICSLSPFQKQSILAGPPSAATALRRFLNTPHRILTSILIGNALSVVASSVLTQLLARDISSRFSMSIERTSFAASVVLFAFVVMFGDILAKTLAKKHPRSFAAAALPFLPKVVFFLSPLARLLFAMSRFLSELLGVKLSKTLPRTSSQDLAEASELAYVSGKISHEEKTMLKGILEFPEKEVRQVMVPEVDIKAVDINWGKARIFRELALSGHSRIPVYSGSLDNIVGVIYTKDILGVLNMGTLLIVQDIMRAPTFVPETAPVKTLLKNFSNGRQHLSIVVDEYGKVTGLITLEDVLEEITGDIFDEFDKEVVYKKEKDGSYIVPASEDVDRVNSKLSLSLPEHPASSIGGLILEQLDYVPRKGESVEIDGVVIEVHSADRQKITSVRIRIPEL